MVLDFRFSRGGQVMWPYGFLHLASGGIELWGRRRLQIGETVGEFAFSPCSRVADPAEIPEGKAMESLMRACMMPLPGMACR